MLLLNSYELLNKELISELKGIINDFDQESLFKLLLDLLHRMGYSTNFVERKISAKMSCDIRLSGIVNIDELGLNRFFVIAHNNTENEIDLVDVQSFVGALSSIGIFDERPAARKQSVKYVVCAIHAQSNFLLL